MIQGKHKTVQHYSILSGIELYQHVRFTQVMHCFTAAYRTSDHKGITCIYRYLTRNKYRQLSKFLDMCKLPFLSRVM